jgi:adenine phosphoribosyltransferase
MDLRRKLETGEKFLLRIPGLSYPVELPKVVISGGDRDLEIASLNLIGMVRLNHDLGILMADRIRKVIPDLDGVVIVTVVEKALQLAQVAACELGVENVAVAYNRLKPHMESGKRPTIQVGANSITSGGKFLTIYERDLNLLKTATRGVVVIDDVISTGGTIHALVDLLEEAFALIRKTGPEIIGIFCAAIEGYRHPLLPGPVYHLAKLPPPLVVSSK